MKVLYSVIILLSFSFLPFLCPSASAQVIPDRPEAVFDTVRTLAYDGRLEEAELMARELVKNNPDYGDAIVLLARIVAWQERYKEALVILDTLIAKQAGHNDALDARSTIVEWMQAKEDEIISRGDTAMAEAEQLPGEHGATDSLNRDVDIFLGYYFDTFRQPYSRFWQIFRVGAQYETSAGPLLGTVNFGNLHADNGNGVAETGIQVQAEFWPQISEKSYGWLAYAYSPFRYFPRHRAAAEYWYSLERGWVVSAGASYFYFDRNIFIPTFSIEKYAGKYWLAARTYIHLKEAGTSSSVFLSARRYFNDNDYIQLTAGAGTAPDEPWDLASDLERQKAIAVKLSGNKKISNSFTVKLGAGYSREEYLNEQLRNRFEGFLNIYYRPSR